MTKARRNSSSQSGSDCDSQHNSRRVRQYIQGTVVWCSDTFKMNASNRPWVILSQLGSYPTTRQYLAVPVTTTSRDASVSLRSYHWDVGGSNISSDSVINPWGLSTISEQNIQQSEGVLRSNVVERLLDRITGYILDTPDSESGLQTYPPGIIVQARPQYNSDMHNWWMIVSNGSIPFNWQYIAVAVTEGSVFESVPSDGAGYTDEFVAVDSETAQHTPPVINPFAVTIIEDDWIMNSNGQVSEETLSETHSKLLQYLLKSNTESIFESDTDEASRTRFSVSN